MRIKDIKFSISRRDRAARFSWEFYRGEVLGGYRNCFFQIGIASPNNHRWWAVNLYIYWKEF